MIYKYNIVYYFDSSKSEIDIISSDSPIVANEKISDNKYNCSLEDSLSYYYLMISRGYWQPYPGEHDSISTCFDKSLILYLDYILVFLVFPLDIYLTSTPYLTGFELIS